MGVPRKEVNQGQVPKSGRGAIAAELLRQLSDLFVDSASDDTEEGMFCVIRVPNEEGKYGTICGFSGTRGMVFDLAAHGSVEAKIAYAGNYDDIAVVVEPK